MDRQVWIDWVKVILMYLVVCGHFLPDCLFKVFIYAFHVPLWFMISGYLNHMVYNGKRRMRIKRLLVPYLIWTFVSVVFISILEKKSTFDVIGCFIPLNGFTCWNAPLWFLYALFFVEGFFPTIDDICNRYFFTACIAICGIAMIVMDKLLGGINILAYRQILLGWVFFIIGQIVHKYNMIENASRPIVTTIMVLLPIGVLSALSNGQISIWRWHIKSVFLLCISAISLSVLFILLCKKVCCSSGFLKFVLPGSMFVFCGHYFVRTPLFLKGLLPDNIFGCLLISFVVYVGMSIAYYFYKFVLMKAIFMRLKE